MISSFTRLTAAAGVRWVCPKSVFSGTSHGPYPLGSTPVPPPPLAGLLRR